MEVVVPKKPLVAVFTLACLLFTYLVPWNLAYATTGAPARGVRTSAASGTPPETPSSARIEAALRKVERLLDRLPVAGDTALTEAERLSLHDTADTVAIEGAKVLAKLEQVASRLSREGRPAKYHERNADKKDRLSQELAPLTDALHALAESTAADRDARAAAVRAELAEVIGAERHNPVDPEQLPHRPLRAEPEPPRTDAAAFRAALSSVRVVEAAAAPTAGDLAATPDVRLNPELDALAASLGRDPLAIYNWVRQNVMFVPTWGSVQGSEGCRLSLECNAHDTASLLVALLRASGVPARYVVGTVEVGPTFFRSAMGDFEDVGSAAVLAASGGIPTVTVGDGTGNVAAVRLEHVWVEAFVDYVPSRGRGASGETWVPLDAALKPTEFQAPADLEALTGVDADSIAAELAPVAGADGSYTNIPTASAQASLEAMAAAVVPALDAEMPDATVAEVFGGLLIDAAPAPLLPASLQSHVVAVGGRTAELPASARHHIDIEAVDRFGFSAGLQLSLPTVELADQRLTLNYVPATDDDRALAASYGGIYTTPPHLLDVRPQLLVEGVPAAAGAPVRMGAEQRLRITFREPGRSDSVEHRISAGTFAAVGLDLQRVSRQLTERRKARLDAAQAQVQDLGADTRVDDVIGEMLHLHGLSYFQQVEATNRLTAHQLGVRAVKRPAEGLVTFGPRFGYLFGTAVETGGTSFNIDVRRYLVSAVSRTADRSREVRYVLHTGGLGSAAEHGVFESLQGTRSVSAVKLLAEANLRGIPIYQIDANNLAQVMPLLDLPSAVRSDVVNSVNAGKVVTVPQHAFQYLGWSGVGYLVLDPATGAGGYLISGGLAGGGTAEEGEGNDVLSWLVTLFSWVANQGGDDVVVKALAKVAAGLEAIQRLATWLGRIAIGVSAIFTFATTWHDTGSFWKGLGAGLVDLLASLAVGAIIGTAFIAGLSLGWTILAILAVSIVFTLIVQWINGWLFSFLPWWRRRGGGDRFAWRPGPLPWPSRGGDGPLFAGLSALPVGV
jgi:hypothetical protein